MDEIVIDELARILVSRSELAERLVSHGNHLSFDGSPKLVLC